MADERYVCTMAPFFPMGSFGPYLISPCISIILCGLQKRFEELFLTVCLLSVYQWGQAPLNFYKTTAKTVTGVTAGAVTFGTGTAVMAATNAVEKTTKTAVMAAKKVTDRMQEQTALSIQQGQEAKAQENIVVAKVEESKKDSTNSSSLIILIVAFVV